MKRMIAISLLLLWGGVSTSVIGQQGGGKKSKRNKDRTEVEQEYEIINRLSCNLRLDRARSYFEKGLLERIPPLLSDCGRNSKVSVGTRKDILKLLAETHLFLDQESLAADYYEMLLRLTPFYEPDAEVDHPELVFLSNQFESQNWISFGVKGGGDLTLVNSQEQYIQGDTVVSQRDQFDGQWNSLSGLFCSFRPGGGRLELTLEALTARSAYQYRGQIETEAAGETASLWFDEIHKTIRVPFSLKYLFGRQRIQPYVYGGVAAVLVRQVRLEDVTLTIRDAQISAQEYASGINLTMSDPVILRKNLNATGMLGLGFQYHIKQLYWFVDVRYNKMLTNIVDTDNRLRHTELNEEFWHVDNDLFLDSFNVSVGVAYSLYKTVRRE